MDTLVLEEPGRLSFVDRPAPDVPAQGMAEAISGGDPDRLFPVVFDATGSAKAMGAAFEFVRPGGRLVLDLLEDGDLDPADWITHHLSLGEVPDSLPELLETDSGFFKAIVDLDA